MKHPVRYWSRRKPVPPGWRRRVGLEGCHHGHYATFIVPKPGLWAFILRALPARIATWIVRAMYDQRITYWKRLGSDGFGSYTYDAPQQADARWEDRVEDISDDTQDIERSRAVIFTEDAVLVAGDYVAKGEHSDDNPSDNAEAYEVRQTFEIPSVHSRRFHHKALV